MTARDQIGTALALLERIWPLHDGPGHIVYADCNLRDSDLEWCIARIDEGETFANDEPRSIPTHPAHVATRALLAYLLTIPAEDRETFSNDGSFYTNEWYDA